MHCVSPPPPPPSTLGAMLATFGQLTEFRVTFSGSWGTVTLFGDRMRKRNKPCAPGAVKGGGTKTGSSTAGGVPVFRAVPRPARSFQRSPKPVAVPSGSRSPFSNQDDQGGA